MNQNILLAMKTKALIPLLFVLFVGCEKKPQEVPDNVIILEPVAKLVDSLSVLMPENGNAVIASPDLFSETAEKNIVLTKESEVYVTFIDEVASFTNTLCWYSYDPWDPPVKLSDITQNVVFPNISKKGEGGQLEAGYTVQLGTGKFPAGTIIGFSLIISGWENGVVNYNKTTHYTDYILNIDGKQKHVLFK